MQMPNAGHSGITEILYEVAKLSQSSSLGEKNLLFVIGSISRAFNFEKMMYASYDAIAKKFVSQYVTGFSEDDSKLVMSSEIDIDPSFFSVSSVKVPADPVDYFKSLPINSDICRFSNQGIPAMFESNSIAGHFLMPMVAFGKLFGVIIAFHQAAGFTLGREEMIQLSILVQTATFMAENLCLKLAENQKISKMTTLYEISQQTKNIVRPADALGSLVDVVKSLIDYNMCALYVTSPASDQIVLKEFRGDDPSFIGSPITIGQGPVGEVAQTRVPLLSHHGIYKSFLAVPVIVDEKLVGVIVCGSLISYAYNDDDKITVKILASQVASIDNLFSTLLNIRTYTESILESMPLGIITVDTEGHINIINQTAKLYLNLTKFGNQEIIGKRFSDILDADSTMVEILSDSLSKGFIFENFEIFNKTNNMNFEITTFQFKNSDGARLGIAMFIRDITRIRKMEEHIRRTDRLSAVGELASGIAHEIRNPLTGIKMMIQILDKDFEQRDSKHNKYTKAILEEIDRLDNIISNLLNFARPSKPEFCDTNVADVIESTLFLLQSKIAASNITVLRDYEAQKPIAKCDPGQIKQVMFNICQNAIQALTGRDVNIIKIAVKQDECNIFIGVSDTGCGIAGENHRHIFNPFFTTKDNGTGLGLSIVHRILEEHNGGINMESEQGRGSTFTIRLPKAM